MEYGASDFDFAADPQYSGSPPGSSEAPRVDAALPPTTGNADTPPHPDSHGNGVDLDAGPGGPPASHPPSGPRPAGPRSGRVGKRRRRPRRRFRPYPGKNVSHPGTTL